MQFNLFDSDPKPTQYQTHDEVIAAMHALTDDPLAVHGTNMVIYRGNPHADLMIIGEAPGANEDQQGKPYVGRSGKLLDKILESVGFDSQEGVYVSNSAFRRPPENRDPTPDEMAYYRPYLMELIRAVNPKIIVLSGRISMWQVLGKKRLGSISKIRITKMRGQWHEVDGRWVMPVFHPAYLLRNPSRKPGSPKALMWKDIQEVRRKYDELGGRQDLLLS